MAVRTNTLNGGTTYVDMDIQVVSADASQYTLRAVIYLTSLNVSDTSNSCSVTGQWGRSGTLNVGGVYNSAAVWYQDVSFARTGADQLVGWNLSWSGVNYWGGTLSGTAYYTIPAAVGPPATPSGYSARNITSSSAYTTGVGVASDGGSPLANLWVQWGPNANMAGAVDRQMNAFTDGFMDGIPPGQLTYFRVAVSNASYWSAWGAVTSFTTAAVVPSAPAAPTVSAIAATTATVTWSAPSNGGSPITSYGVQVATDAAFTNVVIFQGTGALTGLTRATPYWVRVRAGNAVGVGAYSAATPFTTLSTTPGTLTIAVDQVDNDSMRVSWTPPADNGGSAIVTYGVFVATDAAFLNIIYSANHVASPVVIDGLDPGTPYWVVIYAYNVNGYGASSNVVPFITTGTPGAAQLSLNVGGVWKPTELWLNVAGTWKLCQLWMNTHGTWRRIS